MPRSASHESARPARPGRHLGRYLGAVRPGFLSITLCGCLLGFASALHDSAAMAPGVMAPGVMALTIVLALLVHAAVNVINDYCDHLNGSDAANHERVAPYTGGSRYIQDGLLSPLATRRHALSLGLVAILGGLGLVCLTGPALLFIGLAGVTLGWAYSAPPLALNSRGLGELTVCCCFLLVVVGADFVLRLEYAVTPWLFGLNYALLTTNILVMNQFPDAPADAIAGKRHWVVRLGRERAPALYHVLLGLVVLLCLLQSLRPAPGRWVLLALIPLLPALHASRELERSRLRGPDLRPAIESTLLAAHAHTLALALILSLTHSSA